MCHMVRISTKTPQPIQSGGTPRSRMVARSILCSYQAETSEPSDGQDVDRGWMRSDSE